MSKILLESQSADANTFLADFCSRSHSGTKIGVDTTSQPLVLIQDPGNNSISYPWYGTMHKIFFFPKSRIRMRFSSMVKKMSHPFRNCFLKPKISLKTELILNDFPEPYPVFLLRFLNLMHLIGVLHVDCLQCLYDLF